MPTVDVPDKFFNCFWEPKQNLNDNQDGQSFSLPDDFSMPLGQYRSWTYYKSGTRSYRRVGGFYQF